MLFSFPLIFLVVIAYNVIVFAGGGDLGGPVFSMTMMSGGLWGVTVSDVLIVGAVLLLFLEILKSTRTSASSIVDHILSTLVFIICLIEFLVVPEAATSTFFLIMLIALIDVIAGYSVTIRSARRDFTVGPDGGAF